jgi:hypothetical protein
VRIALCVVTVATGCSGAAGTSHARGAYYHDNSGLDVETVYVESAQSVTPHVDVNGRVLIDHLAIHRKPLDPADPHAHDQASGHPPDVVTSASSIAGAGAVSTKNRYEGRVRVDAHGGDRVPWRTWLGMRTSTEPDYGSVSALIGGQVELANRNTVLAADLGFGRDTVSPVEAPPGQLDQWPASHHRVTASASASQVMSRDILLSAGLAATSQRGRLANPYRRAIVRTTLFPEVVPDARDRVVGYVGAAVAATPSTGVHARMSFYTDSWSVSAFVPELAVVQGIGSKGLATAHYRYYRQYAADFYRPQYTDIEPLMSGDSRLGVVVGHTAGANLSWVVRRERGEAGAITIEVGYDLMHYRYLQLNEAPTLAHMAIIDISIAK